MENLYLYIYFHLLLFYYLLLHILFSKIYLYLIHFFLENYHISLLIYLFHIRLHLYIKNHLNKNIIFLNIVHNNMNNLFLIYFYIFLNKIIICEENSYLVCNYAIFLGAIPDVNYSLNNRKIFLLENHHKNINKSTKFFPSDMQKKHNILISMLE